MLLKSYKDIIASVISIDGKITLFDVKAGILRSDTIAPYLFIYYNTGLYHEIVNRRIWELLLPSEDGVVGCFQRMNSQILNLQMM